MFNFKMESKRSCWSSFICCGMSIQKGCFVFSILNLIICSLAVLYSTCGLIYNIYASFGERQRTVVVWFLCLNAVCFVATGIALTFAAVLYIGVLRSKKGYVLAYLVYGIITLGLSVAGILIFVYWGRGLVVYASYPIGVCVIYTGILELVYQTYEVISEAEVAELGFPDPNC